MLIFDLDGTLADCEHRRPLVAHAPDRRTPQWDKFYQLCDRDTPIKPIIDIMLTLRASHEVQIWSGRSEVVREKTERWLAQYAFGNFAWIIPTPTNPWYVPLRMRPAGDTTPDDALKERWLREAQSAGKHITMVFDDRDKVVAMWRRNNIICAQVARGDF